MVKRRFIVLIALVGCRTELHTRPISQSDVRAMTERVDVEGETTLKVETVTDQGSVGTELKVRQVVARCHPNGTATEPPHTPSAFDGCLIDDPKFTWQVAKPVQVADPGAILRPVLALALVGGLVYGNVECFAGSCGTGAKVAVGVGDGVVILGLGVGLLLYTFAHYD